MSKDFDIQVVNVLEMEDGGAMVTFDMDEDALKHFACIGLKHVLVTAIEEDDIKNKEPTDER